MIKWFRSRYIQLVSLVLVLMGILLVRLFLLTVVEKDDWSQAAEDLSTKTIYETAPRGRFSTATARFWRVTPIRYLCD